MIMPCVDQLASCSLLIFLTVLAMICNDDGGCNDSVYIEHLVNLVRFKQTDRHIDRQLNRQI